jgi:hypothetical protein
VRVTRHAVPIALALAAGACATTSQSLLPGPPRATLELRQAQSRTFETTDQRLVLKAALNILQDEGFVIRSAEADLGLVTAVKEWRSRQPNQGLRLLKWVAAIPTYGASLLVPTGATEFSAIEANVNVMPEGALTRVRISLVSKVTEKDGKVRSVTPVEDPLAYQRLLAGFDKGFYLQKEGL